MPPTSRRMAPIASGVAPAGAKAWAVPVVPHKTPAASTIQAPRLLLLIDCAAAVIASS